MKINESPIDRFIRAILGSGLVAYGLLGLGGLAGSTAGLVAVAVGGMLLFTAAIGFCPLYKPLGINTCKIREIKTARK